MKKQDISPTTFAEFGTAGTWPDDTPPLLEDADRRGAFDGHIRQVSPLAIGPDSVGRQHHEGLTDLRTERRVRTSEKEVVDCKTTRDTKDFDLQRELQVEALNGERVKQLVAAEIPTAVEREGESEAAVEQAKTALRGLSWRPNVSRRARALVTFATPFAEGVLAVLTGWYMGWTMELALVFGAVLATVFAVSQYTLGHLLGTLRPNALTLKAILTVGLLLVVVSIVWINLDREQAIRSDNGSIAALQAAGATTLDLQETPPVLWLLPFGLLAALTGVLIAALFAAGLEERELEEDLARAEAALVEDRQRRQALEGDLDALREDTRRGLDRVRDRLVGAVRAEHDLLRLAGEPERIGREEQHLAAMLDALRADAYQRTDKARDNGRTWLAYVLPSRFRAGRSVLRDGAE